VCEIDDAADAEDQRETKRNQEVLAPEHQAIHHLLQQKSELHVRSATLILFEHDLVGKPVPTFPDHARKKRRRRLFSAGAATPVCPTPVSGFYAFMLQGFCVFVG
jgi:hypothetical protein